MDRDEKEKQEAQDVKELFASTVGLRVLKKLSRMCHAAEATYVDQNPNGTAYKEGQRSIIIYILKQLNKDLSKQKQKEAKNG